MNIDELMTELVTRRDKHNVAIEALRKYKNTTVKAVDVRAASLAAGVDASTWNGSKIAPAPPEPLPEEE